MLWTHRGVWLTLFSEPVPRDCGLLAPIYHNHLSSWSVVPSGSMSTPNTSTRTPVPFVVRTHSGRGAPSPHRCANTIDFFNATIPGPDKYARSSNRMVRMSEFSRDVEHNLRNISPDLKSLCTLYGCVCVNCGSVSTSGSGHHMD